MRHCTRRQGGSLLLNSNMLCSMSGYRSSWEGKSWIGTDLIWLKMATTMATMKRWIQAFDWHSKLQLSDSDIPSFPMSLKDSTSTIARSKPSDYRSYSDNRTNCTNQVFWTRSFSECWTKKQRGWIQKWPQRWQIICSSDPAVILVGILLRLTFNEDESWDYHRTTHSVNIADFQSSVTFTTCTDPLITSPFEDSRVCTSKQRYLIVWQYVSNLCWTGAWMTLSCGALEYQNIRIQVRSSDQHSRVSLQNSSAMFDEEIGSGTRTTTRIPTSLRSN